MLKRRIVVGALVAGLLGALAPIGAAPAHATCASEIGMWFWYGVRIEYSQLGLTNPATGNAMNRSSVVGPPVNFDTTLVSCTVAQDTAGFTMKNPVLPGATLTSARDNGAECQDVGGHVVGLGAGFGIIGTGGYGNGLGVLWGNGAGDHQTWLFPRDAIDPNACDQTVFNAGAGSPTIPLDPTQLGTIEAWTDRTGHGGRASYTTLDR